MVQMSQLKSLSGEQKVALLLLAMGKPLASQVLRHFTQDELRWIPRNGADFERVTASEFETLVEEFGNAFSSNVKFPGTPQDVEDLIEGALSAEEAQAQPEATSDAGESVWQKLSELDEKILAAYVAKEHPQIASVILGKISADMSAKVLTSMESRQRRAVMARMLTPPDINGAALDLLEAAIAEDLLAAKTSAPASEGRSLVANIINKLDESQVDEALEGIAEIRPEDAKALRGMLFSFNDIGKIAAAARAALLDKIPTDRLVMALHGTDQAFQDAALTSLSQRSKRMVESELKSGQNPPARDIRAARRSIADLALAMAGRGELDLTIPETAAAAQVPAATTPAAG